MENEIQAILLPTTLLPVLFTMGWFAVHIDIKTVLKQARSVPTEFYRSFDALVDRNSGRTAYELTKVINQQSQSYDLNLTLDKLYRQRRESDEAINIHRALLDSSDTMGDKRKRVLFELVQNYQSAGLVNRTEQVSPEPLGGNVAREARQHLMNTYRRDRDWVRIIKTTQLLSHDEQTYQFEIAQFYYELVQAALFKSDLEAARGSVCKALDANKKCTRISMILGDIESKQGDFPAAVTIYGTIEQQNHAYLSMIGEKLYDVYTTRGKREEGLNVLIGYMETFPDLGLINAIREKSLLLRGEEPTVETTVEFVWRKPDLNGVYRLLGPKLSDMSPAWKADTDMIRAVIDRQLQKNVMYRCRSCRFRSQIFFWHCLACNEWKTFTPNHIEA